MDWLCKVWCRSLNSSSMCTANVVQLHIPGYAHCNVEMTYHHISALTLNNITATLTYSVESVTPLIAQNCCTAKSQWLSSAGLPSNLSGLLILTLAWHIVPGPVAGCTAVNVVFAAWNYACHLATTLSMSHPLIDGSAFATATIICWNKS